MIFHRLFTEIEPRLRGIWRMRRLWQGKVVGGLLGCFGGWFGAVIGILIGHLSDELYLQWRADKAYAAYLDNPGASDFPEPAAGSAAFCALAAMIMAGESSDRRGRPIVGPEDTERVVRHGLRVFAMDPDCYPVVESYVVQALAHRRSLNIDLLAESLACRRADRGDGSFLADALFELADDESAAKLAARIAAVLDATGRSAQRQVVEVPDEAWMVLGLDKGTPIDQVKSVFRQLAAQFHPDALQGLDDERVRQSSEAFIKIEKAYRVIIDHARIGGGAAD